MAMMKPESVTDQLRWAGRIFTDRAYKTPNDSFASRSGEACFDLARYLENYGRFRTAAQNDYALKLISWAEPKPPEQKVFNFGGQQVKHKPPPASIQPVFKTTASLFGPRRLSKLDFGEVKLSLKNDGSVVWLTVNSVCCARMDPSTGVVTMFARGKPEQLAKLNEVLARVEADPLGEAKRYGKESGTCCVCSRMLTDPVSIDAGIGPVCSQKF